MVNSAKVFEMVKEFSEIFKQCGPNIHIPQIDHVYFA